MTPAILVLADGTVFSGISIGYNGYSVGEVVFNTSLTGYQEILTDPSYTKQLVTLTYPHIGNVGVNQEDSESNQVYASGLIIRNLSLLESNFRSECSLEQYLIDNKIVAISEIDTRQLTKKLRSEGSQAGCIMVGENLNVQEAQKLALSFGSMSGQDLAQEVSCQKSYEWKEGEWKLGVGYAESTQQPYHVVAYDFGCKKNILRKLAERGCRLTVVPAKTSAEDVFSLNPDGIFLSNGPGDPEPCDYAIDNIQQFLQKRIPIFGICLGHQLLALALGAKTRKMKFGHHGANHPVFEKKTEKVLITSQNHGFDVDETTLPDYVELTHYSLFDGSVQGISLKNKPVFSFQGHPEASPGPSDVSHLFDQFIENIKKYKQ